MIQVRSEDIQEGSISGLLTVALEPTGTGLVMAHGAGGNARAAFLAKLATALAGHGIEVLRIDLPFRQKHAGPPRPATRMHSARPAFTAQKRRGALLPTHAYIISIS